MAEGKTVKIQQIKSEIGYNRQASGRPCAVSACAGSARCVELEDTPAVRGMINKVRHLVVVLED